MWKAMSDWRGKVKGGKEIKVFLALDLDKYTWRTARAVARQTGLSEEQIWAVVKRYPKLVRLSETPSISGDPLVGLISRVGR